MVERRRLVREEPAPVASSARTRRGSDDDEPRVRDDERGDARRSRGGGRGWTRGRPPLQAEFDDLGRGSLFVGIESAAIALDTAARVLRSAIDRAFDEDYDRPGDLVRGVANEADLAAYDLATELRGVPRRLSRRFDDSLRSPRADRGERDRRSEENGGGDDARRAGVRARLRRNDD
jgi:hypothetical protein